MAAPVFVADEVVTAAKMNSLPKGVLGYAEVVDNQASIASGDGTDLTGLAVTVDVQASRRIRIFGRSAFTPSSDGTRTFLSIKEGTTTLATRALSHPVTLNTSIIADVIITPGAGSHTYKLTMIRATGTSLTATASATAPAYILCEDIGGV